MKMAGIKVFKVAALLSAFVVVVYGEEEKYLNLDECVLQSRTLTDTDGYAPFKVQFYRCNNVFPSLVPNASCMYTACVDPKMKWKMSSEYRSIPIYSCRSFKGRPGTVKMAAVVGCRCIYNKDYEVKPPKC